MTGWKEERCPAQPLEIQQIAPGLLIQRKDIEKVEHEAMDGMDAYTDWICVSREITESEYQMLTSIEEIDTNKAIDDYTEQLMEEGLL